MSAFEDRKVLNDTSKEQVVNLCMNMHPDMTREEIVEKLENGEGVEFNMDYAIRRIREIVSQKTDRN